MAKNKSKKQCPKCGSTDIDVLSCGTTLCHEKHCRYLGRPGERYKKKKQKVYKSQVIVDISKKEGKKRNNGNK